MTPAGSHSRSVWFQSLLLQPLLQGGSWPDPCLLGFLELEAKHDESWRVKALHCLWWRLLCPRRTFSRTSFLYFCYSLGTKASSLLKSCQMWPCSSKCLVYLQSKHSFSPSFASEAAFCFSYPTTQSSDGPVLQHGWKLAWLLFHLGHILLASCLF